MCARRNVKMPAEKMKNREKMQRSLGDNADTDLKLSRTANLGELIEIKCVQDLNMIHAKNYK